MTFVQIAVSFVVWMTGVLWVIGLVLAVCSYMYKRGANAVRMEALAKGFGDWVAVEPNTCVTPWRSRPAKWRWKSDEEVAMRVSEEAAMRVATPTIGRLEP